MISSGCQLLFDFPIITFSGFNFLTSVRTSIVDAGHFNFNIMNITNDKVAEIEVSYKPAAIANKPVIISALDAFTELIKFYNLETISLKEKFVVMYLNRGNKILGVFQLSEGGITATVVDVRLLLSVAVKIAAVNIILCHNHPSGNLIPSTADKEVTCRIIEACKLLDIKVLDHLIITGINYHSFAEHGLL